MKTFIAVIVIIGVSVYVNADLSDEQKQKLKAHSKECIRQTRVSPALVQKALKGTFTDNPKLKAFVGCISKKIGFQDPSGKIQRDVIKQKLSDILNDPAAADALIEKCVIEKENSDDTAFEGFKCYYANTRAELSDEEKQKLKAYGRECIRKSKVSPALVKKAYKGTFTDNPKLKAFFGCMSKKFGFQDESGKIQRDVIKEKLGAALNDPAAADTLIEKCVIEKENCDDTAYEGFKCYYANTPKHIILD